MLISFLLSLCGSGPAFGLATISSNHGIPDFNHAKRVAREIHRDHAKTIYCGCSYTGTRIDLLSCGYHPRSNLKRALRLEWEHVVPAEAFGQSFAEWREGAPECRRRGGRKFKGRKCAEKNPEFSRMEGDLYNLWPEVGELNGLRSNFSMAEIPGDDGEFGGCKAKVVDRKFEPMDFAKGTVARTYLYMEQAYPGRGIISEKNRKLFAAWDKQHPVTEWECLRAERIRVKQGNANPILAERCGAFKRSPE